MGCLRAGGSVAIACGIILDSNQRVAVPARGRAAVKSGHEPPPALHGTRAVRDASTSNHVALYARIEPHDRAARRARAGDVRARRAVRRAARADVEADGEGSGDSLDVQ